MQELGLAGSERIARVSIHLVEEAGLVQRRFPVERRVATGRQSIDAGGGVLSDPSAWADKGRSHRLFALTFERTLSRVSTLSFSSRGILRAISLFAYSLECAWWRSLLRGQATPVNFGSFAAGTPERDDTLRKHRCRSDRDRRCTSDVITL